MRALEFVNNQRYRNKSTGVTVKVKRVEDTRVEVVNHDTGERQWVPSDDFKVNYRLLPPLSTPVL